MTPETPVPTPPPAAPTPPPSSEPTVAVLSKGADSVVTDVNASLWKYIIKRQLPFVIAGVVMTIIWEILALWLIVIVLKSQSSGDSHSNQGLGYLVALPFVVFGAWISRLKDKFEEAMLEEFALSNGFTFDQDGGVDEAYASIFKTPGKQKVSDIVTGTYKGNEMRLFLYKLTVNSGRYSTTYRDTIMELDLKGLMPHLLAVNKKAKLGEMGMNTNLGIAFENKQATTVSLEGDFGQFFTVNCIQGEETDALEIFTPDVMELMEDESRHYCVEIVNNLIYIYSGKYIGTSADIEGMFKLAEKLIAKLGPVAARMKHDAETSGDGPKAVEGSVDLASGSLRGPSLKKIIKVTIIWLAAMVGVGVLLAVYLTLTPAGRTMQNSANEGLTPQSSSSVQN